MEIPSKRGSRKLQFYEVYLCLRSDVEQVETVDIGWYHCIHGVISKHTHSTTLGEFAILIVQILCESARERVWGGGREREGVVCVCERDREGESVYVCMCERER